MSTGTQDVESELIESVCERVRERVAPGEVEEAEAFVRAYYRARPPRTCAGASRSTSTAPRCRTGRSAAAARRRTALVRVYNPTFEQHGWQSPHTAIDIVSDDMPFLVDSVSMELSRREAGIHVLVHPVIGDESYMHIEIDRQADGLDELADALRHVLAQVRAAVEDWQPMQRAPAGADRRAGRRRAWTPPRSRRRKALLAWIGDHHFTFLGYREYALEGEDAARRRGHRARPAARRRRATSRPRSPSCRRPCARSRSSRTCWC